MYGDEFLPYPNRDRCNPLFRVHKSEWVQDKIERKADTIHMKQERLERKVSVHEREAKIKLIKQLQLQKIKE